MKVLVVKVIISSLLFFVLSFSETDARVVEAIEAIVEAAELAAFACDVKEALCKCPTAVGMAEDFTIIK